jgi:hypothetical protein
MAYALHIEQQSASEERVQIPLEEWKLALAAVDGVRLCNERALTLTSKEGNVLRNPHRDGDAEVYFPQDGAWYAVFAWHKGSVTFELDYSPGESASPVWTTAAALARQLGAIIRGDDGERYDLQTGKVLKG